MNSDDTQKFECTVDGKWQASYALTQKSIDFLYRVADLLMYEEEGSLDLYDVRSAVEEAEEEAS